MKIWDLHCHLSGVPGESPEERIGQLVEIAARMGIERLCVYMGMQWSKDPEPAKFRRENDEVMRAIAKYPRQTFGFVYLNPKHVEASLAELERCVANGPMVGVKLWVAHRCSAKELDPIIRRAAELKAVTFQHTWAAMIPVSPRRSTWRNWPRGILMSR
jgi:predicted TIM-barrel fold metal-dependent hydrolase